MKRTFLIAGSLGLVALAAQTASAEQVNSVSSLMSDAKKDTIGQVTSVSQLSDVQPTDWAFQALQSLVERYGCIAGYPDGTFRGNRAATRYELAAALNACLDQISDRFASKEDLATVKALQEEFKTELATLKGRVDGLEARTKTLEAQQFSTTTKLQGEVVMAVQYGDSIELGGALGNTTFTAAQLNAAAAAAAAANLPITPLTRIFDTNGDGTISPAEAQVPVGGQSRVLDTRATALARVRLNFNTSFTGSDLLQTQLEVGNGGVDTFSPVINGSRAFVNPTSTLAAPFIDGGVADYSGTNTNVTLRRLAYSFKPMKGLTVTVGPRIFPSDFVDFNSYANNSAQDFSSGFFINNPLIITNGVDAPGGAGAAVDYKFGTSGITARAVYVAASPTNSVANTFGGGLFGDPYQATAEIEYAKAFGKDKKNNFAARLQYTRSSTFNLHQNVVGFNTEATFGRFGVFGRVGYSIQPEFIGAIAGNDYLLTWMGGVGVKDLFIPGSLLAGAVGQPLIVDGLGGPTQTNFEAFYRFPINDNITITPAVMVLTDVGNINTDTVIQGVLRATFSF